jgi:protein gp37
MGQFSGIEWTEATWNPWHGCVRVSPGCAHCYMYREKKRYGQEPSAVIKGKTTFGAPLKWSEPCLIFTCSWSDFFIEEADSWRPEAWDIIRATPRHTYQILTKRPERIAAHLPDGWPFANVWLGVSVENPRFYWRIELLRQVPAFLRFLSLEPLLAPMPSLPFDGISWVIVGGESGPKCRRMKAEWVREIRAQCVEAGVPFFFKQWGGPRKDVAGRKLDGRVWNEMPSRPKTGQQEIGHIEPPSGLLRILCPSV